MLKFLDNRTHQKQQKSPIKYKPEMVYGNSYQSPPEFQTKHSLFFGKSYLNPHLVFQKERQSIMAEEDRVKVHPKWISKTNMNMVQEQKILSSETEGVTSPSRYLDSHHNQFISNKSRFRMTKGEFSSFLDKNNHYKSIGPLHGDERNEERILLSKKSVWLKSTKDSKLASFYGSFRYFSTYQRNTSSCNFSIKSSISKNSELITEKNRIRNNREKVNHNYRKQIERRKKQTKFNFQLPKIGLQQQIIHPHLRYESSEGKMALSESRQNLSHLQSFQASIYKRFR